MFLAALDRTRPEMAGELIVRDKAGLLIDVSGQAIKEESLEARSIKSIEAGNSKLQSVQDCALDYGKIGQCAPKPGLNLIHGLIIKKAKDAL